VGERSVELDLEIFTFDIDFAGHVSNIAYIRWLEIGRLRLLTDAGLPVTDLLARGLAPVLTRTEIDYRWPLRLGDPVHLALWMEELRAVSATLQFLITSGARTVATARQAGLFVNAATGRPHRLPPEVRARFEPWVRGRLSGPRADGGAPTAAPGPAASTPGRPG
jgi:acyl-CoA thioester hydrolase